jgi:hypothetical protein
VAFAVRVGGLRLLCKGQGCSAVRCCGCSITQPFHVETLKSCNGRLAADAGVEQTQSLRNTVWPGNGVWISKSVTFGLKLFNG